MTADQARDVYRAAYQFCQAVSEVAGRSMDTLGDAHAWYYSHYDELQDAAATERTALSDEGLTLA